MRTKIPRFPFVLILLIWMPIGCLAQLSAPWSWGPVLGAVGEDYVAMTWMTNRAVGFDLRYSLAQVYDASGQWEETLTFDRHEGVAEIWLQDLLPGSTYRYQLIFYEGDAVYPTEVGSFRTLDRSARSFSFSVYGATRSHPDRNKLVADAMAADDVSLVFHAGGLVDTPTVERFDNFFWAIADLARSHPFVSVLGARDGDETLYYDYFALPVGGGFEDEQWWSFDYGDIHFVGLDSTRVVSGDAVATVAQTAWLEADLAGVIGKLIVIFCHDALYGASYPGGVNEPLREAWEDLFRYYGVDVVFSASSACYEHIYRSGVHYVTTGGGGSPLSLAPETIAAGTVSRRYGMLHYMRCVVADDTLMIEAVPVASVVDDVIYLAPSGRAIDTILLRAAE
jgi:hypothetical protein